MVFVDESAASESTLWRRYGYSLRGTPAVDIRHKRKGIRWSILPVLGVNSYIDGLTCVIQGSVTADVYEGWLERLVLPYLLRQTEGDGGRTIYLVMDNCKTYRKAVVRELYTRVTAGAVMPL